MRNYIIGFIIGVVACLCVFLSFQSWRCFGWRAAAVASGGETEIVLDSVYVERSARPVHITGLANSFVWRSAGGSSRGCSAADSGQQAVQRDSISLPIAPVLSSRGLPHALRLFGGTLGEESILPVKGAANWLDTSRTIHKDVFTSREPWLFVARLDTVFRHDTISIRYEYPANLFTFSLHPRPDSVLFKQIVVRQKPEPWWVKPALIIGGVAAGVIIGRSVSN